MVEEVPPLKTAVIIDTNVLINQIAVKDLVPYEEGTYEVFTLQQVFDEIRDERTRLYVHNLPFKVTLREGVDEKDFEMVQAFAKETGDFSSLSKTDMEVIALGVALAREAGQENLVKKEPAQLTEFKPEFVKKIEADLDEESSEEEPVEEKKPSVDDWNTTEEKPSRRNRRGK